MDHLLEVLRGAIEAGRRHLITCEDAASNVLRFSMVEFGVHSAQLHKSARLFSEDCNGVMQFGQALEGAFILHWQGRVVLRHV